MVLLLQTLGIVPSIRRRMMSKSTRLAYILRVSGYDQIAALADAFGEKRRAQIDSILAGYERHIKPHGFERADSFAALTVRAIDYEDVETTVYSMETSTGTLIASSGLVCHNCFPKDVKALAYMAQVHGSSPQLLHAVMDINETQRRHIVLKLEDLLGELKGKTIGMLGLAFKENTDDIRVSPALEIAEMLHNAGATVRGYDPVANENVSRTMPFVVLTEDPYQLSEGCDALVVATPWNEFKSLDMERIKGCMRQPIMVDGRNLYEPQKMKAIGFDYRGVGRGFNGALEEVMGE
ncbi:MAG: UDP-glucose/GDP-mannose dehydrogenase family protein [Anaerolineae bacterium]|nr:UDP-glucose/GDP-mannose dehydrogenase family protein [Anaerolineae bacterium]